MKIKSKIFSFLIILLLLSKVYPQQEQKYIDFELILLNSTETLKLSNIVGKKIILLNFWASWCPFCVKEISEIKKLYETYKDKGLEIISINIAEPQKIVSRFIKEKEIKHKVALDLNAEVSKKYNIRKIPTNFIIDLKGNIIFAAYVLPKEEFIETILPKPTPAKETKTYKKIKQKK